MRHLAVVAAFLGTVAIVACTTTTTSTTTSTKPSPASEPAPTEPEKKTEEDAATGSSSGGNSKDSGAQEAPKGACAGETSQQACIECCAAKHEDGSAVYFVALIDCVCEPSNCASECALTMCDPNNPQNPDAACNTCMAAKNA